MKLSHRIILYITAALVILFSLWAFIFYKTSKHRIYDHIDQILTQQSDIIINRFLENDSLPNSIEGRSGTVAYFIERVSAEYAEKHQTPVFFTEEDYIDDIQKEETFRELTRTFQKRGVDYELTLTTQVFAWDDTLNFAIISIFTLAVALLITIILIVTLIIISNMKPIYQLTNWLRNRTEKEDIPKPDIRIKAQEFKEIEAAVLESTEKSKQLYEEQKLFIGNASHEIQTPLAICRNRLELLVDNTNLDEYQLTEIQKTLDTLSYISRLNKSLLLLSKIESHQFTADSEININQQVGQAVESLSEIYEDMNIKVEMVEKQPILVHMDPTLAASLITNLLKNAFVHNKPCGNITIRLENDILSIQNTGIDQPLDAEAIFRTFYKKGENPNSSGLGLAIVKAICNEYNFIINYQFIENQHVFSIAFK